MGITAWVVLASGFSCPSTIETTQSAVEVPSAWVADVQAKHHWLDEGQVYLGHPSQRRQIQGVAQKGRMTWDISKGASYWVVCSYQKSSIRLMRKLDAPFECEFSAIDLGREGIKPATFECLLKE